MLPAYHNVEGQPAPHIDASGMNQGGILATRIFLPVNGPLEPVVHSFLSPRQEMPRELERRHLRALGRNG